MCRFASLCKHFFPVKIDVFQFFVRGSSGNSQIFTFCWFWLGTMHWNGLSGAYLRLEASQIQYHRFWVSVISGSSKNHNFRLHCYILLILTGKNALKLLEWCIFRVWGMPNPMALVASPYNKWFMKNHNFRRHIAANGVQIHENGMGHMQHSSLGHILPLHNVSKPWYLDLPITNAEKP